MMVTLLVPYCLEMLGWLAYGGLETGTTPPTKISGIDIENWYVWKEIYYIFSNPSFFGIHVNSWECNFLCDTPCCWGNDWTSDFSCWLVLPVSPFVQEGVQKFSMELSDFFWWCFFKVLFLNFPAQKLGGTWSNLTICLLFQTGGDYPPTRDFV